MQFTDQRILALHDLRQTYAGFNEFQPGLPNLLQQGSGSLIDCVEMNRVAGLIEPLTGEHVPPDAVTIQGDNYRETLIAKGLLSRNRAVLLVLETVYGSLDQLKKKDIYLVEALTGFAAWLSENLGDGRLLCSEYLADSEGQFSGIPHQDLCALTFPDGIFDLVICNELFEHVQDLPLAFQEVARVLKEGGRLVATCPKAFGQVNEIVKVRRNPHTGETQQLMEAEFHGDPVRPDVGSLVYRIPGWDVLSRLRDAGFADARVHHIASWKHGVLGSDLPGVLVIEAQL